MSLKNRHMLSVEYLLLFLVWNRMAPRTLLIAAKCAGSWYTGPFPVYHTPLLLDPVPILQRPGRGLRGGMGTQAESSYS